MTGIGALKTFQRRRQRQGPQWLQGHKSLRILLDGRDAEKKAGLHYGEFGITRCSEELAIMNSLVCSQDRTEPFIFGAYINVWDSTDRKPKRKHRKGNPGSLCNFQNIGILVSQ